MDLGKPAKIILGGLTIWPLVYPFICVVLFFTLVVGSLQLQPNQNPVTSGLPAGMLVIFALHLLTAFIAIGLLVVYLLYLYHTERVPADKKALWAVVLFLGSVLAMAVFFCIYIWPSEWPRDAGPERRPALG
ncbi:hypothetical protein [Lacipirellula parvula]|uniref:Uncharacterized protein n=1 Tax=Lacipirellula parvula TaxID=2650471 RepID=A0A5K7XMN8_9BACT|nr:hypothetical protein [Lacipirellula parvula]BBO35923.1 hypothetical protein PLANPX_5535 [Lacipirellula parvula]